MSIMARLPSREAVKAWLIRVLKSPLDEVMIIRVHETPARAFNMCIDDL